MVSAVCLVHVQCLCAGTENICAASADISVKTDPSETWFHVLKAAAGIKYRTILSVKNIYHHYFTEISL